MHSVTKCPTKGFRFNTADGLLVASTCTCVEDCARCAGTGECMKTDERGYDFIGPCPDCGRARHIASRVRFARIPAKCLPYDLSTFKPASHEQLRAIQVARGFVTKYARDGRPGFSLFGSVGTMKTSLLCAMLRELIMLGESARYSSVPTAMKAIKAEYNGDPKSKGAMMSYMQEAQVAVFDEIHRVVSEHDREHFTEVIMHRYESGKATFFAGNLASEDELYRCLGSDWRAESVVSRIHEMAPPLYVKGPDQRRKAPQLRLIDGGDE